MDPWQRKSDTQDPAKIYERKESLTCQGCIHQSKVWGEFLCLKYSKLAEKKMTEIPGG